ncbi:MAG TPA: amidohydrolase family protein [Acidimicrobiales bacterium]|nr:amidohydrolase family protein [Acidimicrobiales bacterium]
MGDDVTVVSIDSHFAEPEDLWSSRLPEELAWRAPAYHRVGRHKLWVANGRPISLTDEYARFRRNGELVAVAPDERPEDVEYELIPRDDLEGRLADMEVEGVWGEVIHPNVGLFLYDIEDVDFGIRCGRIYNDYVAERFATYERLVPTAIIQVRDIPAAVAEIERVAGLGFRGLGLPLTAPPNVPYFLDVYDPIWDAADAVGLPIAMHAGSGSGVNFLRPDKVSYTGPNADRAAFSEAMGIDQQSMPVIPHLIGAGVPERHPDLHFFFVETGAGWLANLLELLDQVWGPKVVRRDVNRTFFRPDGSPTPQYEPYELSRTWPYPLKPSEYAARQFHVGFMEDYRALRHRDVTGVDILVWGNDYPHYEGTYPKSREAIERMTEATGLSPTEKRAIFGGTVAHHFKIPLPTAV